jgi:histidinol-phosphate aminotransferase
MAPYVPGKPIGEVKRELGLTEVVKLASNENPLGPSPLAVAAVKQAAEQMHFYPDASGFELRVAIAEFLSVDPSMVMLGNGSDELIGSLGLIYLEPGDNIVTGTPTFVRYDAAAEISGTEHRRIPLDSGWRHDLSAMAAACDERTKLVFLANPHNPTGTVVTHSEVAAFLEQLPKGAVCVLDQAYFEFTAGMNDRLDAVALLKSGAKVVALRTLSKAYGLAGIRVGYGVASPEIVAAVDRVRAPFNVNALAQAAAVAALNDRDHLKAGVELNTAALAEFSRQMTEWGLVTVPSGGNFACVAVDWDADEVFRALLKEGVIVRSGNPLGMPGFIRVSMGTPAEMAKFYAAFAGVMGLPNP